MGWEDEISGQSLSFSPALLQTHSLCLGQVPYPLWASVAHSKMEARDQWDPKSAVSMVFRGFLEQDTCNSD